MEKFFSSLVEALWPSPETNEPKRVFRWRQTVAFTQFLTWSILTVHIGLACGLITIFGFTGFAANADVAAIQRSYVDFRAGQIENKITDAKTKSCLAYMQGNQTALDYQNYVLQQQLQEYFRLVNRPYPVPSCDQLVVAQQTQR